MHTQFGSTPARSGPTDFFRSPQVLGRSDLRAVAQSLFDHGFRLGLVAAQRRQDTAADHRVVYLFLAAQPDRRIELAVDTDDLSVPSLALLAFPAGTFERELYEAHGILARSHPQQTTAAGSIRPTARPVAARPAPAVRCLEQQVEGRRQRALPPRIERVVPDTGVAHALAYCLAVEQAHAWAVPPPVPALRAMLLEMERIHHHLRAFETTGAKAGLSTLSADFHRMRQRMLTLNQQTAGHRLLRGAVLPGGISVARVPTGAELRSLQQGAAELCEAALTDALLRESLRGKWILTQRHAAMIGALGFVARASGIDIDARRDHPFCPLTAQVTAATATNGDVLARLQVRAAEIDASFTLLAELVGGLQPATVSSTPSTRTAEIPLRGVGLVEGSRGTIVHRVEITADGRVTHLRVVDPAFLTRSVLALSQRGPHDECGSMVDPGFGL